MQYLLIIDGNLLSNKVKINLNVLCALMLDWVGGHVGSTNVVTIHKCGPTQRGMKLLEELAQPSSFGDTVGHYAILGFSTRSGDGVLSLGGQGDEVVPRGTQHSPRWTCVCLDSQPNQHQCKPEDQQKMTVATGDRGEECHRCIGGSA